MDKLRLRIKINFKNDGKRKAWKSTPDLKRGGGVGTQK